MDEIESTIYKLRHETVAPVNLMGIPQSYLKEINMEMGKNYIEVLFGSDSTEHLVVSDETKRMQIFEYLKANVPNSRNFTDEYSKLRAGKKPLIAMAFIIAIFAWTLYLAIDIENGIEYELVGRGGLSIAAVILLLANLGVVKVVLLFTTFLLLAVFGFIRKVRNPKVVHKIEILR